MFKKSTMYADYSRENIIDVLRNIKRNASVDYMFWHSYWGLKDIYDSYPEEDIKACALRGMDYYHAINAKAMSSSEFLRERAEDERRAAEPHRRLAWDEGGYYCDYNYLWSQ